MLVLPPKSHGQNMTKGEKELPMFSFGEVPYVHIIFVLGFLEVRRCLILLMSDTDPLLKKTYCNRPGYP